jgi:1-acyl-sn-glycerol-3-phosphate acyltransferase
MLTNNQIQDNYFYKYFINVIYPILILFYPIQIKNPENIYKEFDKSCIYISRHTSHNYDILLGLFTLNKNSPKIIRPLGHYLIYI